MRCDVCPAFHVCFDPDGYSDDVFCNVTGERDPGREFKEGSYGCNRTLKYINKKLEENEILYQKELELYNKMETEWWEKFGKEMEVQNDNSKCN